MIGQTPGRRTKCKRISNKDRRLTTRSTRRLDSILFMMLPAMQIVCGFRPVNRGVSLLHPRNLKLLVRGSGRRVARLIVDGCDVLTVARP